MSAPARRSPLSLTLAALVLAMCAPPAPAQEAPATDVALTVYSHADPASFDPQQFIAQQRHGYNPNYVWQVPGFGVVKEVRQVTLPEGAGELALTDVAQFIDPTTVSFEDLMDPGGTTVLEQQFLFDLVSPTKLLERYVDREIGYERVVNDEVVSVRGRVLSVNQGQVVLHTSDGLRFVNAMDNGIRLPALPEGLITKPTLAWKLDAGKAGERRVRTTYQTGGITWRSDYNLVLDATDTKGDLGAWVTLMNLSGTGYANARLKLIAGDVQRVQQQPGYPMMAGESRKRGSRDAGFEEKSFFEYHLYTLPRRTDVAANTTQQIALFPTARNVGVEKVLVYYGLPQAASWRFTPSPHVDRNMGNQSNPKVDVYVKFENREDNRLGMPLPKGKVRVYKKDDADGTLEFVGEDLIDHTPRDETVMIKLGQAFDVVGERTQTDFRINTGGHLIEETYRIQIRNHKDEAAKVVIRENLFRWTNWEIVDTSDEFEKVDSRTIHFPVAVPARGEKTVTYRVRYTW